VLILAKIFSEVQNRTRDYFLQEFKGKGKIPERVSSDLCTVFINSNAEVYDFNVDDEITFSAFDHQSQDSYNYTIKANMENRRLITLDNIQKMNSLQVLAREARLLDIEDFL
jgi:hypothetical protein